jgi:hypothetical protein
MQKMLDVMQPWNVDMLKDHSQYDAEMRRLSKLPVDQLSLGGIMKTVLFHLHEIMKDFIGHVLIPLTDESEQVKPRYCTRYDYM